MKLFEASEVSLENCNSLIPKFTFARYGKRHVHICSYGFSHLPCTRMVNTFLCFIFEIKFNEFRYSAE